MKNKLFNLIKGNEGTKLKPYIDPISKHNIPKEDLAVIEKYWNDLNITIGYGRNLQDNGISIDEANSMLEYDIFYKMMALDENLFKKYEIELTKLPENVQMVLVSMAYQMGVTGLMNFKNTFGYIKNQDYKSASVEMLDSLWFRDLHRLDMLDGTDSVNRAEELSNLMKGGN